MPELPKKGAFFWENWAPIMMALGACQHCMYIAQGAATIFRKSGWLCSGRIRKCLLSATAVFVDAVARIS